MNEKSYHNDPLSAWHSGRAVGSLPETGASIASKDGFWENMDTGSTRKQDGAGLVAPLTATWRRRRGEIKGLACLCICLALWMGDIPNLLAQTIGRAGKSMQRPMAPTPDRTLRFTEDGNFQISIFEDLHFAENSHKDVLTQKVISHVLSKEKPQLVVINGDLVSGEQTKSSDSNKYVHQVVSPLVKKGYVWASTYGNHDSNPNLDPWQDVYDQERKYPNSLTQSMVSDPDAGVTNYYLPVYPSDESESEIPALILWFFDSKGGRVASNRISKREEDEDDDDVDADSSNRPDWVHQSVTDWFTKTNANLHDKYGKVVPSLAFYHIPADAMRAYQDDGVDPNRAPGINGETVVQQGSGDTPYVGQDTEFMRALLNTSGLMATFSGHDHENDWCFKWDGSTVAQNLSGNGLNMCYGRHTGYGGYGDAARGGRQIVINEETVEDEVETWILLEDDTITGHVTLNGTYGQDKYSPGIRRLGESIEMESSGISNLHPSESLSSMVYLWFPVIMFLFWKH
ncbi:hypothetical protein N7478_006947 [Penicillium angulare]|uniref:uncharacterized protein n=1 Tax=Penicillium angulare TaxID=116970 RepID=UPI00253FCAC7|nr:uncharacterized protein N7478_006947 [Penicillium angulare]KAJ5281575.1 hypothetical protein N7478_006947 [Penicillium angulare]